nr:sodium/hydrogen exchanger 7-like [Drosophila takahashii]
MSHCDVDAEVEMTSPSRMKEAAVSRSSVLLLLATVILGLLTSGCEATDTDIALDAKATLNHRIQSLDLLVFVFLLALTVLTIWLFKHHRVSWLHETGLAVIYGMLDS